ncbi:MAG: DUF423 domain-containing protein [Pseudomonadota bacterium]|nr:hypothetical protein [Alteromonadaceae bacterium]MCP4865282.1 DUF423 domain-containing protein [Alteromonas sp.]MDY6927919.1 DUF423 domain-containing protein [Pseudomonadota bacterium]RPH21231.1 MAG: DUF423 domain-containing protein [Alteromonadaceae bacterium TMED7]|tara:strand:+ start:10371 stop:10775 length:405 start_codon:yes stop_codon:yes gene_type:complete
MRMYLLIGALLALLGVMLGAFGAHGLKNILDASALATFEVGVRYQMYHALAILLVGGLAAQASLVWRKRAALLFIIGSVLFSGSIYLLVLTGQKWLGPVTPLGGLCLMLGWVALVISVMKGADNSADTRPGSND